MRKFRSSVILLALFIMVSCSRNVETDVKNTETSEDINEDITEDTDKNKYKITYLRDFEGYELGFNLDNYDDIYQIVDENQKIGFIDSNGNMIVKPQYNSAYQYGDIILVSNNENSYFVNFKGEVVLDNIKGRKMATAVGIDEDIGDEYFIVGLYNDDGSVENKNYIVDSKGNIKYETEENYGIAPFLDARGVCYVVSMDADFNSYDKVEFIMFDGSPVPESDVEKYTDIFNNYMTYNKTFPDGTYFVSEGKDDYDFNKSAIANKQSGELITGFDFRASTVQMVGKNFVVEKFDESDNVSLCIIDNKGNVVKSLEEVQYYKEINSLGNYFSLSFYNEGVIIFDENGNVAKETNYDSVYKELTGTIKIKNNYENPKYGYLSDNLVEMLPPEYDEVTEIYNNTALVVKDNKLYRFDIN